MWQLSKVSGLLQFRNGVTKFVNAKEPVLNRKRHMKWVKWYSNLWMNSCKKDRQNFQNKKERM